MGALFKTSLAFALAATACVPRQVVPPRSYPAPPTNPPDFSTTSLYLRSFTVDGGGEKDSQQSVEVLRRSFAQTVARVNRFRTIIDLQDAPQAVAAPALLLDVSLSVGHSTWRTWLLDLPFFVPCTGYWPLTPRWGDATVKLRLTVLDSAGEVSWSSEHETSVGYWLLLYSWYRTRPIEEAYMQAYAEVFARVAAELGAVRDELVAAAEAAAPSPPPGRPATPPSDRAIKIAVVPTQIAAGAEEVPGLFDDYLLSAVQNAGNFQVIGQADIQAMLGFERQKDLLGCSDAACMAGIGGALGVDLLVQVRVARVEQDWVVTAKLINIREARVDARTNDFINGGVKALLQNVPGVVAQLFASPTP